MGRFCVFAMFVLVLVLPAWCQSYDENGLGDGTETAVPYDDEDDGAWEEEAAESGGETVEIGPDGEVVMTEDAPSARTAGIPPEAASEESDE